MKNAIVTGGAGGIGSRVVDALMTKGFRVGVFDTVANTNREDADGTRVPIAVDATDEPSVRDAFSEFLGSDGRLHVLVNCVGVMHRGSFVSASVEEHISLIRTNVEGVIVPIHVALDYRSTGMRIVNIGSIWAEHLWPGRAPYSASKAAVEQMSRCLDIELCQEGVRVACVSPGLVRTGFTEEVMSDPQFNDSFMPRVRLGRAAEPEEVAAVIVDILNGKFDYGLTDPIRLHGGYY